MFLFATFCPYLIKEYFYWKIGLFNFELPVNNELHGNFQKKYWVKYEKSVSQNNRRMNRFQFNMIFQGPRNAWWFCIIVWTILYHFNQELISQISEFMQKSIFVSFYHFQPYFEKRNENSSASLLNVECHNQKVILVVKKL